MQCPYCGREVDEKAESCPDCGKSFDVNSLISSLLSDSRKNKPVNLEPDKNINEESSNKTDNSAANYSRTQKNRKKSRAPVIAAIICLLAAAIVVVVFALPKFSDRDSGDNSTPKTNDSQQSGLQQDDSSGEMPDNAQPSTPAAVTDDADGSEPDKTDADITDDGDGQTDSEPQDNTQQSEYVLPESDSRYYTYDELSGLSQQELLLARNEIYARHGWIFENEQLKAHFESCSWYEGTVESYNFDSSVLNDYEIANKDLILKYESDMGYK